jgi:hypothetical protein
MRATGEFDMKVHSRHLVLAVIVALILLAIATVVARSIA